MAFLIALGQLTLTGYCCLAADLGPLWDRFPLTLGPGERMEAAGPFYYRQQSESQHTWAVPPLFSRTTDPELEYTEYDFAYPILTYDRFGDQYRWQFFQLLSFAGGPTQTETNRDRFTLFPIVFYQRSSDPDENYFGVLPIYGHTKNRFGRDDMNWVAFPAYLKSRKKDVYTWNYLFPIFHIRRGDDLEGWQVFPLIGHETKGITFRTNGFGDTTLIGGHDRWFGAWPLYHHQRNLLGTTNEQYIDGLLPAYFMFRSPQRDSTSALWPFFTWVDDREKNYREWQGPWPFVAFARGEGKTLNRVLPFYSHGVTTNHETRSVAWPIYREARFHAETVDRKRTRILFFLYSDIHEKNLETGAVRTRRDLWPLFTRKQELDGKKRLQVLAVLEPVLANNKSIERNYSPLYSVWRQEADPRTGASSQSLLWNLYRRDVRTLTHESRTTALFGLFRADRTPQGRSIRLFYIPLGGKAAASTPRPSKAPQK